ncbi:MAG: hypothetical protein HZB25_01900 [Candidatus Eisenbacteria bacterium]|nr:hypothetical protein [Candidatus Eisenbacteria bacterium]
MDSTPSVDSQGVTLRIVIRLWWPLAASWLLMGFELPAVSAVMARLPHSTVSLAAYGGVVFPLALLIESPIIMLLSASTALSRDWQSYRVVRRYMYLAGGATTLFHALVAFTPLFDLVVGGLLHPPAEVLGPARLGLQIMLPWTMSIAYRRTQQGVLIRAGRSRAVGIGTGIRLAANCVVLAVGYYVGHVPGIVVGTLAVAAGVMSEAVYAGFTVQAVLRDQVRRAAPQAVPLTMPAFLKFFLPLALTPLILFLAMPIASAAVSRMPRALECLAAFPVVSGLVFTLRSLGFAFNEVVVALLERPGAVPALRRFAVGLALATTGALTAVALTPLAHLWFSHISALPPALGELARAGLGGALLMPAFSALQSLYQGTLVHVRSTRGITESVVAYLAVSSMLLAAGVVTQRFAGLPVAMAAMSVGTAAQVLWLRARARPHLRGLQWKGPPAEVLPLFPAQAPDV